MTTTVLYDPTLENPALKRPFRWDIASWFSMVHIYGFLGIAYQILVQCHPLTILMAIAMFFVIAHSISLGPHRLWAHKSYKASKDLEWSLMLTSTASWQAMVMSWSGDHRLHHWHSDTERDPYTVKHGFWWAHVTWMLYASPRVPKSALELRDNPILQFQYRNYWWLAPVTALGIPSALGSLWGDATGGFFLGFTRLMVQYHLTWIINSVAHTYGKRPYKEVGTARVMRGVLGAVLSVLTAGESNHHPHHVAPNDPCLGREPGNIDTSWSLLLLFEKWGLVWDLNRVEGKKFDDAVHDYCTRS